MGTKWRKTWRFEDMTGSDDNFTVSITMRSLFKMFLVQRDLVRTL